MKPIPYPFEFNALLITSRVLNTLGFTPYWGGVGAYGDRRLDLGGAVGDKRLTSKGEYPMYWIMEMNESVDPDEGYGLGQPEYQANHYCSMGFEKRLYFIHEMYEDILLRRTPEEVHCFLEKTIEANIFPYIDSWIKYKQTL